MNREVFALGDFSEILSGLEGRWVALSVVEGKLTVSGSGDSIKEAIEEASGRKVMDPVLMRVPEACYYIL